MAATEINTEVEKFFKKRGIKYERKSWLYLCHLEGRQFYYSPRTGKWRLKGEKAWQLSQSPADFLEEARKYSPRNQQKTKTKTKTNTKTKAKTKTKTKAKTKTNRQRNQKSNYKSKSSQQDYNSEIPNQIRPEFLEVFGEYLELQRERGYKIGWIWHSLLEEIIPTPKEICWLSVAFGYSPGWAFYQIRDLYGLASWEEISRIISANRSNWLHDFTNRWGTHSKQERKSTREQQSHQANRFSHYIRIYQIHLEVLKISFPFSKQELKSAYRKRALETHPDAGGTAKDFREVHDAYQVLLKVI